MTVDVKRTCESNVRATPGKFQFNSFTVSFTGPEFLQFQKILDLPGKPKPAEVLEWILYEGLQKKYEKVSDLYKEWSE
ncbi:MAG: hypothetical protein IKY66_01705 [Bacteroidales bacterium]|nr:hypothetical protein [Bacteroidales bacterium]